MHCIKSFITFCLSFLVIIIVEAQPEQPVKILVAPDHTDWLYKTGEPVKFSIAVIKDGNVLKNAVLKYEVGPEKMDPVKKDSLLVASGMLTVNMPGMKVPGFMRCTVTAFWEGKEYKRAATAAFDPLKIEPVIENPSDFKDFWDKAKADLALIPLDSKMTLIPEKCTEKINVYHVSIQNYPNNARVYGILCVPKKPGKYPAILHVPGAGIRPYGGDIENAEKGYITLDIGIHGIPVNMNIDVYNNLSAGALNGYFFFNMDDKDKYYYKRVYLGCIRANDFIFTLPEFDGVNLAVTGGSQGGALSIVTAALDPRVKYLAAFYPALCDLTGYLKGRAGGWPHIFDKNNIAYNNKKDKLETVKYYDVVNFARRVKIPGIYSWGYNDEVCPPTSMYAAYNVITAPKSLHVALETGHWAFPEQYEKSEKWLLENLQRK
jgi:cephalosporin-C deacetylase